MIIQIVKVETYLPEDEMLAIAHERAEQFRAQPGLLQKYYVKFNEPNHYGGIYVWDSLESMQAFRQSELAATIAKAYKAASKPQVEILEGLFPLRELV